MKNMKINDDFISKIQQTNTELSAATSSLYPPTSSVLQRGNEIVYKLQELKNAKSSYIFNYKNVFSLCEQINQIVLIQAYAISHLPLILNEKLTIYGHYFVLLNAIPALLDDLQVDYKKILINQFLLRLSVNLPLLQLYIQESLSQSSLNGTENAQSFFKKLEEITLVGDLTLTKETDEFAELNNLYKTMRFLQYMLLYIEADQKNLLPPFFSQHEPENADDYLVKTWNKLQNFSKSNAIQGNVVGFESLYEIIQNILATSFVVAKFQQSDISPFIIKRPEAVMPVKESFWDKFKKIRNKKFASAEENFAVELVSFESIKIDNLFSFFIKLKVDFDYTSSTNFLENIQDAQKKITTKKEAIALYSLLAERDHQGNNLLHIYLKNNAGFSFISILIQIFSQFQLEKEFAILFFSVNNNGDSVLSQISAQDHDDFKKILAFCNKQMPDNPYLLQFKDIVELSNPSCSTINDDLEEVTEQKPFNEAVQSAIFLYLTFNKQFTPISYFKRTVELFIYWLGLLIFYPLAAIFLPFLIISRLISPNSVFGNVFHWLILFGAVFSPYIWIIGLYFLTHYMFLDYAAEKDLFKDTYNEAKDQIIALCGYSFLGCNYRSITCDLDLNDPYINDLIKTCNENFSGYVRNITGIVTTYIYFPGLSFLILHLLSFKLYEYVNSNSLRSTLFRELLDNTEKIMSKLSLINTEQNQSSAFLQEIKNTIILLKKNLVEASNQGLFNEWVDGEEFVHQLTEDIFNDAKKIFLLYEPQNITDLHPLPEKPVTENSRLIPPNQRKDYTSLDFDL